MKTWKKVELSLFVIVGVLVSGTSFASAPSPGVTRVKNGIIKDPQLLDALNSILGTNGSAYIITVTRGEGAQGQDNVLEGSKPLTLERMQLLMNRIGNLCDQKGANTLKIVIFNEYFFQKIEPLQNTTNSEPKLSDYEDAIKELTSKDKNLIIYANFLQHEDSDNLNRERIRMKQRKCLATILGRSSYTDDQYVNSQINNLKKDLKGVFCNVTKSFCRGVCSTVYKKASYCWEWDWGVAQGYVYEYGDGYDHPLNQNPVAANLVRVISTEICSDIAYGVRSANRWISPDILQTKPSSLHIIQSNRINPFLPKIKVNLPLDKLVIHATPTGAEKNNPTVFKLNEKGEVHYDAVEVFFDENKEQLKGKGVSDTIKVHYWLIER